MDQGFDQTIFSLSPDVPALPASVDGPVGGGAQVGTLTEASVRELCSVRKIYRTGAVLQVDGPLAVGQFLSIELMSGCSISGTVERCSGSQAILRFEKDLDVVGVIAGGLVNQGGERRRLPRVELRAKVSLRQGAHVVRAIARDVAQGGLKVATDEVFAIGSSVLVTLADFRPIESKVRWCEGGLVGLAFDQEIGWQELMPWLRLQSAHASNRTRPEPPTPSMNVAEEVGAESFVEGSGPSLDLNIAARIREGLERWNVTVVAISTDRVELQSYTAPRFGNMLWLMLPGLEGWPARVSSVDGDRWICEFTQPLHPAVLQRVIAASRSHDSRS